MRIKNSFTNTVWALKPLEKALWRADVAKGLTPRYLVGLHQNLLEKEPFRFHEVLEMHLMFRKHFPFLIEEEKRLKNVLLQAKAEGIKKRKWKCLVDVYIDLQKRVQVLRKQGLTWGQVRHKLNVSRKHLAFLFPFVQEMVTLKESLSERRLGVDGIPSNVDLYVWALECLYVNKSKRT